MDILTIRDLNLHYTEWSIMQIEGSSPGWDYVQDFMIDLYDNKHPFIMVNYKHKEGIFNSDNVLYIDAIYTEQTPQSIWNKQVSKLCMGPGHIISCDRKYLGLLLSEYRKEGEGILANNPSEIFPSGIEWPDNILLPILPDKALVFCNHDGDPIFVFQNRSLVRNEIYPKWNLSKMIFGKR